MSNYLKINELSEYIKLSKSSIYKLTMCRKIPFIKRSKTLLFEKQSIDLWLGQYAQSTIKELQNSSHHLLK